MLHLFQSEQTRVPLLKYIKCLKHIGCDPDNTYTVVKQVCRFQIHTLTQFPQL